MLKIQNFRDMTDEVLDLYDGKGEQPVSIGLGKFDNFYRIQPGTLHVITGIPNHGKSNFLEQMSMMMSKHHGWKHAVFSPEHGGAQYAVRLLEKYLCSTFTAGYQYRMTKEDVVVGLEWISRHYYFITNDRMPSVMELLEQVTALHKEVNLNSLILDPWNEISAARPVQQSETEYVSQSLSQIKVFNKAHKITTFLVAHPAKPQKDKEGTVITPDLYSISGSAHFYNKTDMGLVIHRNFENGITKAIIAKVKEQPAWGSVGEVELTFNPSTRSYQCDM